MINVIPNTAFRQVKKGDLNVRLNRKGKNIGRIVKFKNKVEYLTYRTDDHYFIKWAGFGIDSALIKNLMNMKIGREKKPVWGVIIHYKGKKEERFYYSTLDQWLFSDIKVAHAKEQDSLETYGEQKVLPLKKMKLIGYGRDDIEVKKKLKGLAKF